MRETSARRRGERSCRGLESVGRRSSSEQEPSWSVKESCLVGKGVRGWGSREPSARTRSMESCRWLGLAMVVYE